MVYGNIASVYAGDWLLVEALRRIRSTGHHDLLDRALETPGIQVVIGSPENEMGSDLSLVAARFGSGAVGVIGSTRMDYPQIVPLVRHTALRLARALRGDGRN